MQTVWLVCKYPKNLVKWFCTCCIFQEAPPEPIHLLIPNFLEAGSSFGAKCIKPVLYRAWLIIF